MATQKVKMIIQFRLDTTENWLLHQDIVPAAGEPCYDLDAKTLKIGDGTTPYGELPVIGSGSGSGTTIVSVDDKSIVYEDGVLKLFGFDDAEVGAQLQKNADGEIEWVVPSIETIDGLQTVLSGIQDEVDEIQEILVPSDGLSIQDRIETLETQMNGSDEDSVDAKITAKINEFADQMSDDGTINTFKELLDYAANHGSELDTIVSDVADLQSRIGSEPVQDQINNAISGKVDAVEGKGLSTNDFTDELLEKLNSIEEVGQENVIEGIVVNGTILDAVEKLVEIPVATDEEPGLVKGSTEITVAEDGTLGIGQISWSKITQEEGENVVFDGGGAAG